MMWKETFSMGPTLLLSSQFGLKERGREREFEVIFNFFILKLPMCAYILLTSHIFKVLKVKTFIFLSVLFEI